MTMRRSLALWMICLTLVSARVLGLHLHVCDGVESGVAHAGAHYADNGFLFGEYHAEDDGNDVEVDVVTAIAASPFHLDLGDLVSPIPASPVLVSTVERLLTVVAPRGPPSARPSQPPHFAPPLRGPPSHFVV
ncbi:MAG: hypothetical protein EPN60_10110 [Nevskiaceae bacterium]|nr:MAG: hypothetical protein EPN60_10110 [Nevskiaceae bacterium]